MLGREAGQRQQHPATAPVGRGGRAGAEVQGLTRQVSCWACHWGWGLSLPPHFPPTGLTPTPGLALCSWSAS